MLPQKMAAIKKLKSMFLVVLDKQNTEHNAMIGVGVE